MIDPEAVSIEYGNRVRWARKAAGMTQTELAARLGMSRSGLANVEGGRQAQTVVQAHAMADATGVDVRWLVSGLRPTDPLALPRVDPDAELLRDARAWRALLTWQRGLGYHVTPLTIMTTTREGDHAAKDR